MYVTPYRRTSSIRPEAENAAGTIAAPDSTATLQPARSALEWKSGMDR